MGQVVILNGAPRSGKSSIARAIQDTSAEPWINLGVDASQVTLPDCLRPGIGLRPGADRPDLEGLVAALYAALYDSIAAHARQGLKVVVDVGHHEDYTRPFHILADCARRLAGLPVLWVGVTCPLEVIWKRRQETWPQSCPPEGAVERWQRQVHAHGLYDLEVDTSRLSPRDCARIILSRLQQGPAGTAFTVLAAATAPPRAARRSGPD